MSFGDTQKLLPASLYVHIDIQWSNSLWNITFQKELTSKLRAIPLPCVTQFPSLTRVISNQAIYTFGYGFYWPSRAHVNFSYLICVLKKSRLWSGCRIWLVYPSNFSTPLWSGFSRHHFITPGQANMARLNGKRSANMNWYFHVIHVTA